MNWLRHKLILIIVVAVAVVLGGGVHFAMKESADREQVTQDSPETAESHTAESKSETKQTKVTPPLAQKQQRTGTKSCQDPTPVFDSPPVNLTKTNMVVPLGLMLYDHVTPVDHQYFQNFSNTEPNIEVYTPGDGTINEIEFMSREFYHKERWEKWEDYRLVIQHTCAVSSIYIHVDVLSDKLAAQAPKKPGVARVSIPVKAGEVVGWYKENIDFNLVDTNMVLPGLLVPEHYAIEPWKIHVPDTLEYFTQEIVDVMTAKSLRSQPPYAGKFDWDIDGTLQGNWFEVGTNYYAGTDPDRNEYWVSQLAIAPDYLDYDHIIVSMGKFGEGTGQYGVKGNGPDPATVNVDTGLVIYELVDYSYITMAGEHWNPSEFAKIKAARNGPEVKGVVLAQLVDGRTLKFEAFPGKTASQVSGFTDAAQLYER